MSSDYGDDAGEMMFNSFVRMGEVMGEDAMRQRAYKLSDAYEHARGEIPAENREGEASDGWAKLDMSEFQDIGDYEDTKAVIERKLAQAGVDPTWFQDLKTGTEYLLFKVKDAREVWQCFGDLSKETLDAADRAAEKVKAARDRDERPLDERAEEARKASEQLDKERGGAQAREHGPRYQETRTK